LASLLRSLEQSAPRFAQDHLGLELMMMNAFDFLFRSSMEGMALLRRHGKAV